MRFALGNIMSIMFMWIYLLHIDWASIRSINTTTESSCGDNFLSWICRVALSLSLSRRWCSLRLAEVTSSDEADYLCLHPMLSVGVVENVHTSPNVVLCRATTVDEPLSAAAAALNGTRSKHLRAGSFVSRNIYHFLRIWRVQSWSCADVISRTSAMSSNSLHT